MAASVEIDRLDISDLIKEVTNRKSKDIIFRSAKNGEYLSGEDIVRLKIDNINRRISENLRHLRRIEDGIKAISGDAYEKIISLRYFEGLSAEATAEVLHCDLSTVRRNKVRLLQKIAVRMYGAVAINAGERSSICAE